MRAAQAEHQRLLAEHQRLLADLRAAQAGLARQAAADERRRIAREVHDVIAHSLAITLLHLTGARHVLQRSPQRAAEALAQAEALGRQSMADIRRVVGLLGADPHAGTAAPLPSASDIARLVDDFAAAGLDLHATICGDPARLSAAAGLKLILSPEDGFTIVGECADGGEVLNAVVTLHPEVVVMDVRMKGMKGVEATHHLRAIPGAPPVLILTTAER
ncbi:MAG TPA: histidine kinase [Roseiflexaceae bacterium]